MRSPLKRYGGKYHFLKHLLPRIPEHTCYVEVFCGAAHLYFAKAPAKVNVLNDIDSDIANFFRVLQDKYKYQDFKHRLKYTPYSRELFIEYKQNKGQDLVDRACKWFVLSHQSFGSAVHTGFSRSPFTSNVGAFKSAIDNLDLCVDILRNAVIEQLDWQDVISLYDSEHTFFYLDPPYVLSERNGKGYKYEMDNQQHETLANTLESIKGKYLLSGFNNKIYQHLPNIEYFDHKSNTGHAGERQRTECLWSNYQTQPTLFTGA